MLKCAHLYRLNYDEISYILDTFTALSNGEEREFWEFRSKRMVLVEIERLGNGYIKGVSSGN